MNRKARLERIEQIVAHTPDAGRVCLCPLPPLKKLWESEEGVEELVHQFTRPCPKCGLTRWDESILANFEKAYGGAGLTQAIENFTDAVRTAWDHENEKERDAL